MFLGLPANSRASHIAAVKAAVSAWSIRSIGVSTLSGLSYRTLVSLDRFSLARTVENSKPSSAPAN